MIAISIKKVQSVQERYAGDIDLQYKNALQNLKDIDALRVEADEKLYLDKVVSLFENEKGILLATSESFQDFKDKVGMVPEKEGMRNGKKGIKDKILEALGYTGLRENFYPKYFGAIGIKACVYCNSQLTISVKNEKGRSSGRFDVDHYHSKHEFPWMSIMLFNLYPACAPCNRRKSSRQVSFELYSNDRDDQYKSGFSFRLDPHVKAKYLTSKDAGNITFTFEEPPLQPDMKSFEEVFRITSLYSTQVDIVEELIAKSQIYNSSYRKALENSFSKLAISPAIYQRIILGNYVDPREIHLRPMSKFMQDIATDLGLLPKETMKKP